MVRRELTRKGIVDEGERAGIRQYCKDIDLSIKLINCGPAIRKPSKTCQKKRQEQAQQPWHK